MLMLMLVRNANGGADGGDDVGVGADADDAVAHAECW